MEVKGSVAIVTGGTGGIGFAATTCLLEKGAKYVAILDLDSAHTRAAACVRELERAFGPDRAHYYTCDVTVPSEFAARYDEIVGMQRKVDILVNCANLGCDEPRVHHVVDINLTALINCSLTGVDRMGKHHQGKGGVVVNVSSIFGLKPQPAFPVFTASKYGVYGFTKAMEEHYDHLDVRVVAVCPGVTDTSFLHHNMREEILPFVKDSQVSEALQSSKYIQQPENVGAAIVKMIEEARPGAVWVSENNEPPYEVRDPEDFRQRKVPV